MKKSSKLFVFFSLMVSLLLMTQVSAKEARDKLLNVKELNSNQIKITITNDQTGEVKVLNPIDIKSNSIMEVNSIASNDGIISDDGSVEAGYNVFIPIEDLNSKDITPNDTFDITPLDISGGVKDAGGVFAELYVDYDISSNNEQVRLNKVYGSWTPSSALYYLTNREVNAHSGTQSGYKLTEYPTSNTFSYTTGWGYNDRYWGALSPRAWSSAKINIYGMTATYTITVEFTYS